MSASNYLKSAGYALASYAALAGAASPNANATPLEAVGNSVARMYNLESRIGEAPAQYKISSGLRIDGKSNDGKSSYQELGAHGIQNIKLYSNKKETKAKIVVALDIDEGVYDIRNEHKTEAAILIIPEGSELAHPAIDPKKETSLDVKVNKTVDGKAAYAVVAGAGFYYVTGEWGPSLVFTGAEFLGDFMYGKHRNRQLYMSALENVPSKVPRQSIDRIVSNLAQGDDIYTLTINVNAQGKYGVDKHQPDAEAIEVVDLKKYGGHGLAFRYNVRDHETRNLLVAAAKGGLAGLLYKSLNPSDNAPTPTGTNGGPTNGTGTTTTVPTNTPPISGGPLNGTGTTTTTPIGTTPPGG